MLTLALADRIADRALAAGVEHGFEPLCVVVLDPGAHALVVKRDERSSIGRVEIATGKANGCLAMGFGGRELHRRMEAVPQFFTALSGVLTKGMVPVPGGVLVRDDAGAIIGAVGVSGDTSANDEVCAVAGITAVGLTADTGASQ
ncbi:MAG: GlcG/HbpS family heme-binding protein [Acidimicrobiales bacterium]